MEEYIKAGQDSYIVDPDKDLCYTKRKQRLINLRSVDATPALQSAKSTIKFPEKGWSRSLQKLPMFTRAEVDSFVANSGKKSGILNHSLPTGMLKAKTYLCDEYLHDIETNNDQRFFYFKAKCFHSFKVSEKPHQLMLALCIVSGSVEFANCGPSCAAGKSGFCNHILALMLKVCKYALYSCQNVNDLRNEEDENPVLPCTSQLQSWNQRRIEGVSAEPVMQVMINKTCDKENVKRSGVSCNLYQAIRHEYDSSKLEDLIECLRNVDPKIGLVQLDKAPGDVHTPTMFGDKPRGSFGSYQLTMTEANFNLFLDVDTIPRKETKKEPLIYPSVPLDDVNDGYSLPIPDTLTDSQAKLLDNLKLNTIQSNKIEQSTTMQAKSEEWFKERKYRFTASNFARISRRQRHHEKFVSELLQPKRFTAKSTEHGKKYEGVALREYQKYLFKSCKPVQVLPAGLCINPKLYILGVTPDAKVVDAACSEPFGIAEVKCPYSKFQVSPMDACSDPTFCLHINSNGHLTLKRNHEYYDQIQGQMGVTGAKWCDFIVYTSRGLSVERIPFNSDHWKKLRNKICDYYFNNFFEAAASVFCSNSTSKLA